MRMSDDRIPTMPQADERIPTMPQTDDRIPTMPQADDRIPTMPQSDGRIPTVPQNDGRVATVPQNSGGNTGSLSKIILHNSITFKGVYGTEYVIDAQKIISDDSGESQIYGCTCADNSEQYVARILKTITPKSPDEKLERRKKVIDFLMEHSKKPSSHILPLIDHGTVVVNSAEYFIEIYPFCKEGDIGRQKGAISYEDICKKIIPGVNEALYTFHKAGFVHRDVKPDNLYWYKGNVVLGDFGITCDLRGDGFATDRSKTGTLGYYAPELMSQAALTASDYYSFGQTLWTLYSGEMMYQPVLRRYQSEGIEEQRNQINFSMLNGIYYGFDEIKPEEKFFEILIRGLLQYDPSSRFNYNQVERWLRGDRSIAHEITKFEAKNIYKKPYKRDGVTCWDNLQLFDYLWRNWENAKQLLYSGNIKEFFLSHDFDMANAVDGIVKKYSSSRDGLQYDIGLSKLLMMLCDGACLGWKGRAYSKLSDISKAIMNSYSNSKSVDIINDIATLISSGLLKEWYERINAGNYDKYAIKLLDEAQDFIHKKTQFYESLAVNIIACYFAEDPSTVRYNNCASVTELIESLTNTKEKHYYNFLWYFAQSTGFFAFLYAQGNYDAAREFVIGKRSQRELVENIYSFLEQQIEDSALKAKFLNYYREHSLHSYLLWFKENLALYQFNGTAAQALKSEIEAAKVEGNSLKELRAAFSKLEVLAKRFRGMFVDNVYLAKLGITDGKETNGITSNHVNAYWHKNLMGIEVPIGYDVE